MIPIKIDVTKKLKRARGQIAARWIENRVVVGEGHVFQPRGCHVFIERGPAAILALETQLPSNCPAEQFIERLSILRTNQAQRHQDHCRVVGVRVVNVVVFECPAASFGMRVIHRPIATHPHFLVDQPFGCFLQCRVFW